MEKCLSCGHAVPDGRFCTNCGRPLGAPVGHEDGPDTGHEHTAVLPPLHEHTRVRPAAADEEWRTDTAERPAVPGDVPPAGASAPPPPLPTDTAETPRFPLFADEVPAPAPAPAPAPEDVPPRRTPAWLMGGAVAAVLLLVIVLLGVWLVDGDEEARVAGGSTSGGRSGGQGNAGGGSGETTDVASLATVQVPATAPPNQDVNGNMVRYEGRNMLDGVPETCWRMVGDGTGREITFQLARSTRLSTVGLINGYAKTAALGGGRELDWYTGNRRILAVEWSFDDGTTVEQDLTETREMQNLDIDPVTTRTVHLRLVSVSPPGPGRAARNNTAISDVALVGTPA